MGNPEMPIHPMQAMIDGMGAAWQKRRAATQMTLGALIKALESVDPDRKIAGLGSPMSYRGYYCDLAFRPSAESVPIAEALKVTRSCMGRVFEGYKGGDYQMGEQTPIWSADYGSSGPRIMGLNLDADPIMLVLKEEES
jgi:hypothetical protein